MINEGRVPVLDLDVNSVCRRYPSAAELGLFIRRTIARTEMAVALAESCFSSLKPPALGAEVDLTGTLTRPRVSQRIPLAH